MRTFGTRQTWAIAALLGSLTWGCETGMTELPVTGSARIAIAVSLVRGGGTDEAFERVNRAVVQVLDGDNLIGEADDPTFDPGNPMIEVELDLEKESVQAVVTVHLMLDEQTLFSGSASTQITRGTENTVDMTLDPQAAGLSVPEILPTITVFYDTVPIPGAALFATGDTISGADLQWTSLNPEVVEVVAGAMMVGVGEGTTQLVASFAGFSETTHVAVEIEVRSVAVEPPSAQVGIERCLTFTAQPQDAKGNAVPGRAVTWSSTNLAVATVDAGGLACGVGIGSAAIEATSEGVRGGAQLRVIAGAGTSTALPPPA